MICSIIRAALKLLIMGVFCSSPAFAGKIHVLILYQELPNAQPMGLKNGEEVPFWDMTQASCREMELAVLSGVAPKDLGSQIVTGVTKYQDIVDVVENINCNKTDSVFFYYCGHGATNGEQVPYIFPNNAAEQTEFRTVIQLLKNTNAKRRVVFFDCCQTEKPDAKGFRVPIPPKETMPFFKDLLLNKEGTACVVSASRHEVAWCVHAGQKDGRQIIELGSIFARSFSKLCDRENQKPSVAPWTPEELITQMQLLMREELEVLQNISEEEWRFALNRDRPDPPLHQTPRIF